VDGEFRCIELKDRNGNYISATYNGNSDISTVTGHIGASHHLQLRRHELSLIDYANVDRSMGKRQTPLLGCLCYSTIFVQTNFPGLFWKDQTAPTIQCSPQNIGG